MPSITTSSWFSASEPPPIPSTGEHEVQRAVHARGERRCGRGLRSALCEEALAPASALEDQVARGVEGSLGPVPEQVVDVDGLRCSGRPAEAGVERLAAHAHGVDLVDEDDALAAPLAGEALRAAREDAHDDRVDADERRREA